MPRKPSTCRCLIPQHARQPRTLALRPSMLLSLEPRRAPGPLRHSRFRLCTCCGLPFVRGARLSQTRAPSLPHGSLQLPPALVCPPRPCHTPLRPLSRPHPPAAPAQGHGVAASRAWLGEAGWMADTFHISCINIHTGGKAATSGRAPARRFRPPRRSPHGGLHPLAAASSQKAPRASSAGGSSRLLHQRRPQCEAPAARRRAHPAPRMPKCCASRQPARARSLAPSRHRTTDMAHATGYEPRGEGGPPAGISCTTGRSVSVRWPPEPQSA